MKDETFAEMYKRYASLIIKSVMTQTKDYELAEEICQQTFLAYYQNMEKVEDEYVKAWLLHTAKNYLIDHWRKASTRKEVSGLPLQDDILVPVAPASMEKSVGDREFISLLLEDLKRENKAWYEAIDYICIRGMDYEETAKHLGISSGMLRTRIYRARKYIQQKYGEEYLWD